MPVRFGVGAGVALSLLAGSALAADTYKFNLFNNTTKYTITGFQTYEKDKWDTWSNVNLAPGDKAVMDWNSTSRRPMASRRRPGADPETVFSGAAMAS